MRSEYKNGQFFLFFQYYLKLVIILDNFYMTSSKLHILGHNPNPKIT